MRSAASSMTIVRSGRALDLRDVHQGGDVSPPLRCSAALRHCRRDRRGRRRAGGWPKTERLHRSLILGSAPLTSFVVCLAAVSQLSRGSLACLARVSACLATLSEPKCPPATIAGSSLESALVGPSWASALRRSARKSVRRVDRPSEAYLYSMPGVRNVVPASSSTHSTVMQPRRTTRSGSTTHIGISYEMEAAALQSKPHPAANANAMQRTPGGRPTRTREQGLLTHPEIMRGHMGLSGRALASAVPRRHGSRALDQELRLVRLRGRESTSCRSWCRG
jgi:hypothetical protein